MGEDSPPKFSVVLVWWQDAAVTAGWHDSDNLSAVQPSVNLASGFFVEQDDVRLVLATLLDVDGNVGDCFAIPAENVVEVKVVHEPPS